MNANDILMGGGVKAVKFPTIGASVTGRIVREPEAREQTDYASGDVLRWPNGDPKMQIVVHLATDQRDADDISDDGTRAVYIKGQMLNAVRAAVRAAGAPGMKVGGQLTVTYAADGQASKPGFNAPKQYTASYVAPAAATAAAVLDAGDPWAANPAAAEAIPPAPAGVDPTVWAGMTADQRAAVAAIGQK